MTLEELRNEVSGKTGVPAALLTGDTPQEIMTRAQALIDFKAAQGGRSATLADSTPQYSGSTREQFAQWFDATNCGRKAPAAPPAEEPPASYPVLEDAGEVVFPEPPKSTREQFAEEFVRTLGCGIFF